MCSVIYNLTKWLLLGKKILITVGTLSVCVCTSGSIVHCGPRGAIQQILLSVCLPPRSITSEGRTLERWGQYFYFWKRRNRTNHCFWLTFFTHVFVNEQLDQEFCTTKKFCFSSKNTCMVGTNKEIMWHSQNCDKAIQWIINQSSINLQSSINHQSIIHQSISIQSSLNYPLINHQ